MTHRPTHRQFFERVQLEARDAIWRRLAKVIPHHVCADGLHTWLMFAVDAGLHRKEVVQVSRTAWRENATAQSVTNRFAGLGLAPPGHYLAAVRAAHLGYLIQRGITVNEIAQAADTNAKNIYALLKRHGTTTDRIRRESSPLWLAEVAVVPLLHKVPLLAWQLSALRRRRLRAATPATRHSRSGRA